MAIRTMITSPPPQRIVTGLQPSGQLHLGSYLGTIKQWQKFTGTHECFFFVADLHAITVEQDPKLFRQHILETAMLMAASGIDLEKHQLFVQSQVTAHSELGWLFTCLSPMGELSRMTQFKDKSQQQKSQAGLGLMAYPCLMAADILLYNPSHVPVGADQKQHLELTRNLAERFNRRFGDTFVVPEPFITGPGARVMALQSPRNKMSKSDPSQNNSLFLLDSDDIIVKKIKRAVTDSEGTIIHDSIQRPGISNLMNIYAHLHDMSLADLEAQYHGQGYAVFKKDLADLIISHMAPIRERYRQHQQDPSFIQEKLARGAEKASIVAKSHLYQIKQRMGFYHHG